MDIQSENLDSFPANALSQSVGDAARLIQQACENNQAWSERCEEGRLLIFYIVMRPKEDEALELYKLLWSSLPDNVDPNTLTDAYGQTAFFYAAREGHLDLCKLMIANGFNAKHLDDARQTALFYVCRDGHNKLLRYLVNEAQVPVDHVDINGDTALFYAARDNRESTCKLLVELGADCAFKNRNRKYPSTIAKLMGHKRLGAFLEQCRKNPPSPVESASTRASAEEDDTSKAKRVKRKPEKRDLCCLQYMSPLKSWSHTPQFKIEEFESLFPELAVWDAAQTAPPRTLEADPYRITWHRLATDVMRYLCEEVENAHFFREPVDPVKWDIPDYFEVVKDPMDFGTILTKLEVGVEYSTVTDFMSDLERVFSNCILYNRADSKIGRIASSVREAAMNFVNRVGLGALVEAEKKEIAASKKVRRMEDGEIIVS